MPNYQITAPDGQKYSVTAPDGATQEQVMAYVQSQHQPQSPQSAPQPAAAPSDPSLFQQVNDFGNNMGDAVAHHLGNVPVGLAQGATHLANFVSGGALEGAANSVDQFSKHREQQYQKNVPTNAASMIGAGVGEVLPWMTGLGELRAAGMIPEATKVAGKLGTLALEGGAAGTAQPVTGDGSYASQKAEQIGLGAVSGPALYGAGRLAGKSVSALSDAMAHVRNPQSIADAQIASRIGTDPAILATLRSATGSVPGESVPATQAITGPRMVALDRLLRNNPHSGDAMANSDIGNDAARHAVLTNLAGNDASMAAAKQARKDAIDPFVNQYLTDTSPATRWNGAQKTISGILAKPGRMPASDFEALRQAKLVINKVRSGSMQEDDAVQAMKDIGDSVKTQKAQSAFNSTHDAINQNMADPTPVLNNLRTLRNGPLGMDDFRAAKLDNMIKTIEQSRNINGLSGVNMMDAARQKLGGILGKTSGQDAYALGSPYDQIVNHIERNAPGYSDYLAAYAHHSQPINDMEAVRAILSKVDTGGRNAGGGARSTIPAIQSALKADDAAQYGMSPQARGKIEDVLKSLQSRSVTNNKVGAQGASGTAEDMLASGANRGGSMIFGDPMTGKHGPLTTILSSGAGSAIGAAFGSGSSIPGASIGGAAIGGAIGSVLPKAVEGINAGIARRIGATAADSGKTADAIERALKAARKKPSKLGPIADPMRNLLFGSRFLTIPSGNP